MLAPAETCADSLVTGRSLRRSSPASNLGPERPSGRFRGERMIVRRRESLADAQAPVPAPHERGSGREAGWPCSHGCHSPQSQSPSIAAPDFEPRLPARPGQSPPDTVLVVQARRAAPFRGPGQIPNANALTPEPASREVSLLTGRLRQRPFQTRRLRLDTVSASGIREHASQRAKTTIRWGHVAAVRGVR
jgi:hypothetical protein